MGAASTLRAGQLGPEPAGLGLRRISSGAGGGHLPAWAPFVGQTAFARPLHLAGRRSSRARPRLAVRPSPHALRATASAPCRTGGGRTAAKHRPRAPGGQKVRKTLPASSPGPRMPSLPQAPCDGNSNTINDHGPHRELWLYDKA